MRPDFAVIPYELRSVPRWVVWKGAKVPYCAAAANSTASVTDPDTWASFPLAQTAYEEGGYSGVGFVLNGDGIVGVDLDKCVNEGKPEPAALGLLDRIGCKYIELSPSGTGLRGFGYGENIKGRRGILDGVNVELYSTARYLTVTGHPIFSGPLVPLSGFSEVAQAIGGADLQKRPEDDRSHSSAFFCPSSVGIPATCLPTSEGERNRCLFHLARYIKGVKPGVTREELRAIVQEWHRLALPVIGTKDFTITLTDFMRGWAKVKQPHGETMDNIINAIDFTAPLPTGIAALGYGEAANRLVRICQALQAHEGSEKPFFISARQAGELTGMHYTDASKVLAALVMDGVLVLVSKGSGRVASRYRWAWATA